MRMHMHAPALAPNFRQVLATVHVHVYVYVCVCVCMHVHVCIAPPSQLSAGARHGAHARMAGGGPLRLVIHQTNYSSD